MLDLAILLILGIGFFIGLRRGLILQVVHLTGFIAAFIVSYLYFDELAPKLKLWVPYPELSDGSVMSLIFSSADLESAYYRAIAFAMLFFGTKIVMQILGSMLDFLAHLPILKQINSWAGGVLGFVEVYLIMFLLLYIGALLPVELIQSHMQDSFMAMTIVKHTPIFSGTIQELWIENMNLSTILPFHIL
ncbi:CvpA family protein [Bacillus suaedaesalsae]|uniref:CvpA family protein n=1 Tax=Bacillus suaedaesalsae TaxID=2810349 RepID=A0ABS2DGB9_9BACI|nr:CvpA family protein [Bacillus suaedaesalsae]MBM6617527.1 CvpA family protein [Bacillus suaedaesalsae]